MLRVYDVPEAHLEQVQDTANKILLTRPGAGRVQAAPGGKLLVLADEGVQEGVKQLVAALPKNGPPPPATPSPGLEMTYWVVVGRASEGSSRGEGGSELAEVFRRVEAAPRPMAFRVLERLQLQGHWHRQPSVSGRVAYVEHAPELVDGRIVAKVRVSMRIRPGLNVNRGRLADVETVLRLRPGQTVVLASAALDHPGWPDLLEVLTGEGPVAFYYMVRGELTD